jgi:hypothetical protein
MIKHQLGRRNLTKSQEVGMYAGKLHDLETIAAKERQGRRTDLDDDADIQMNSSGSGQARDIVAKTLGVGPQMIDEYNHVQADAPLK